MLSAERPQNRYLKISSQSDPEKSRASAAVVRQLMLLFKTSVTNIDMINNRQRGRGFPRVPCRCRILIDSDGHHPHVAQWPASAWMKQWFEGGEKRDCPLVNKDGYCRKQHAMPKDEAIWSHSVSIALVYRVSWVPFRPPPMLKSRPLLPHNTPVYYKPLRSCWLRRQNAACPAIPNCRQPAQSSGFHQ